MFNAACISGQGGGNVDDGSNTDPTDTTVDPVDPTNNGGDGKDPTDNTGTGTDTDNTTEGGNVTEATSGETEGSSLWVYVTIGVVVVVICILGFAAFKLW